MKGSYLLIMRLDRELADLEVGRLGRFTFAAGFYLYIGSAFGAGGVRARLAHHARRHKPRPRWHIDYLRAHAALVETWSLVSEARLEQPLAAVLRAAPGLSAPVGRFGASDARSGSHLFYTPRRPPMDLLTEALVECVARLSEPRPVTLDIQHYEEH